MTDLEVIHTLKAYFEGLFPKTCSNCGRSFPTLRDYILTTTPLWPPILYDLEMESAPNADPIGAFAMANCHCGTTLALSSKQMPLHQSHRFIAWIRAEMARRGLPPSEFLDGLRNEIRRQALGDPVR